MIICLCLCVFVFSVFCEPHDTVRPQATAAAVVLPASPPKWQLISDLIIGYKKSVETCHAHRTNGIAKHRSRNEQKNKYPTLFVYTLQSTA